MSVAMTPFIGNPSAIALLKSLPTVPPIKLGRAIVESKTAYSRSQDLAKWRYLVLAQVSILFDMDAGGLSLSFISIEAF
jgi:hypothetical protein